MSSPPSISVIVPCYNQGAYLADAVRSLQAQSCRDWECLIVNDGSTDRTADVATLLAQADRRIRYLAQENGGPSSARNTGLAHASGRFVQFLDADDLLLPAKFEKQLGALTNCGELALSYTDYYYAEIATPTVEKPQRYCPCALAGNDLVTDLALRWEKTLSIPIHCFMFDRRLFSQHEIRFDEALPNHEDWDCWMRIFSLRPKVFFVPEKLACYRLHPATVSHVCHDQIRMRQGFEAAILKHLRLHRWNWRLRKILRHRLHSVRGTRPFVRRASSFAKQWYRAAVSRLRIFPLIAACLLPSSLACSLI